VKLIKEKQHVLKTRSLGDRQWFDETVFEVEPNDVDRARDNHNGYLRPAYRFRLLDVGRHITVSEQGANYTCWWFTCKAKETEMKSQDSPEYIVSTDDAAIKHALTILEGRLRKPGVQFTSPSSARDYLTLKLAELEHELFVCLWLDAQNRLIEYSELFRGTLTQTSIYPREVVKEAMRLNAAAVIFSHNHPSGLAEPSRADEALTKTLKQVLELVEVKVLDHIVIGGTSTVSFAERGLL
jgi:DNA repair protein RadC